MNAGHFDGAIRDETQIVEKNLGFAEAYLCLALAHLEKGEEKEALATYQKVATVSVWAAWDSTQGRADAAIYRGKLSEAAVNLEKGIEENTR